MKVKLLFATALLSLSGAASCATPAHFLDTHFIAKDGVLALKITNNRTDVPVHVGQVSLLLGTKKGQKESELAYGTVANVDIGPGSETTVTLLPVQQLVSAMQRNGEAPADGYSEVFVDNSPGACSACGPSASHSFMSAGFGALVEVSLNGTPVSVRTMFGGYLVFVAK